jgi:PilZ domain
MSEPKSVTDRRQFPRIEVATNVNFAVVMPAYEIGTTRDLSQGGLCLEVKRKLAVGTILRLEFDLPGDKPEHIEALGKVVWQRQKDGEILSTGIKFLV